MSSFKTRRFILNIDLSNDDFADLPAALSDALGNVAAAVAVSPTGPTLIRDRNGNTVGWWDVTDFDAGSAALALCAELADLRDVTGDARRMRALVNLKRRARLLVADSTLGYRP